MIKWKPLFLSCSICLLTTAQLSAQTEAKDLATADSLIDAGQFDKSITILDQLISKHGEKEQFLTDRGFAYLRSANTEKGKADYERALKLNPNCAKCLGNLGSIALDGNDLSASLNYFEQYIKLEPAKPMGYVKRGEIFSQMGRFNEAISDFDKGLEMDINSPYIYLRRSMTKLSIGDANGALDDINRSIQYKPEVEYAYFIRGKCYLQLGQYAKARDEFFVALKKNPKADEYHTYAGIALYNLQQLNEALQAFNESVRLDPKNYIPYLYRSYILFDHTDKFDDACANKEKAKELLVAAGNDTAALRQVQEEINKYCDASQGGYYYYRGGNLFNLGQFDQAIKLYNHGLQFGNTPALLEGRGNAYMGLGKFDQALANYYGVLQHINELDPELVMNTQNNTPKTAVAFFKAQVFNSIAFAHINLNHFDSAIIYEGRAISVLKSTPDIYNLQYMLSEYLSKRASLLAVKKNYTEAQNDFTEALKIYPGSVTVLLDRATMYINKNAIAMDAANIKAVTKPGEIVYPTTPIKDLNRAEVLLGIKDCDAAIGLDPEDPKAYFLRAQAGMILKTANYCDDVKKAVSFGMKDAAKMLKVDCR